MREQWGLPSETVAKTQRSFPLTMSFIFSSICPYLYSNILFRTQFIYNNIIRREEFNGKD
jgi:hypothetical protein